MKELLTSLVLVCLVLGLGGCLETFDRKKAVDAAMVVKEQEWRSAHPAQDPTPMDFQLMQAQAAQEVEIQHQKELAAGKKQAGEKLVEAGAQAAGGNYVAAGGAVLMAVLLYLGLKPPTKKEGSA
jgi:uncharacterized protein HemX